MASHAWHYLAVFDQHSGRPLYLGRSKRIASPDQRIVLHSTDRGCSAGLHHARLPHRSPPRRGMGRGRTDQHRHTHVRMRWAPPPDQTRRLEDPKTQRRHHPMAPTTTPTPTWGHQHLPPPRTDAALSMVPPHSGSQGLISVHQAGGHWPGDCPEVATGFLLSKSFISPFLTARVLHESPPSTIKFDGWAIRGSPPNRSGDMCPPGAKASRGAGGSG